MGTRKVPICAILRRERYLSQKERLPSYLSFNELSTNYFAFPIKTVQIV